MKPRFWVRTGAATLLLVGGAVGGAAPAAAALAVPASVNTLSSCGRGGSTTLSAGTVTGAVGDTFRLVVSGVSGDYCVIALNSVVDGASGDVGIGMYSYTINASGAMTIGGALLTIVVPEIPPEPDPTPAAPVSGPVAMLQQLPLPASGDCADVDSRRALWAQGVAMPWTRNWAEWSDPVYSGWVCERWVYSDGTAAR